RFETLQRIAKETIGVVSSGISHIDRNLTSLLKTSKRIYNGTSVIKSISAKESALEKMLTSDICFDPSNHCE
ncbi:hypothetical protein PFISCL1PPCAC_12546, partial [Pristionchus fissidentatus]